MKRRRLKTLTDIRRFLADALNRYEAEEIDEQRLKTIAYSVNILAGIIKDGELEERVDALEAAQGGYYGRQAG